MACWACFTVRPAMARQASPSGTPGGGVLGDAARPRHDAARRQVELAPPHDVGDVAERADHGDARPLVGLGEVVGQHGHLDPEERGAHGRAEARRVALVVGVGDQRHAGGDQLGPGRLDLDVVEAQPVVGARQLAVLHLGLGHRRLVSRRPTGWAPRTSRPRRGPGCAGTCAGWCAGCGRRWWRRCGPSRPRARCAATGPRRPARPRAVSSVAQRDEVGPADRDVVLAGLLGQREVGVVGERRVAGHAEVGSAPGARWAARCRPSPSGRRASSPACAGSGRWRRSARSRRPSPCGASPTPSAGACRWRRPRRGWRPPSKR